MSKILAICKAIVCILPTIKSILAYIDKFKTRRENSSKQKKDKEFNDKIDKIADSGTLDDLINLRK